jgi:hypothetical protein
MKSVVKAIALSGALVFLPLGLAAPASAVGIGVHVGGVHVRVGAGPYYWHHRHWHHRGHVCHYRHHRRVCHWRYWD